jgi:hypothetical protein
MRERILVAGALAQRPRAGGHAWVFLQYLLGFQRLGYDVLFVDWLDEEICGEPVGRSPHAAYLRSVMEAFGLAKVYSLLDRRTGQVAAGLSRDEVTRRAAESACLLNVMGYLEDEEIIGAVPLRVFLDIDPGFPQMWRELAFADVFAGHDRFVTVGGNVGQPGCDIPTCGLDWISIPPPVVIDRWPVSSSANGRFTTVCTWRGAFGPIEYNGRLYGLRVHEFRRFAELATLANGYFELALDIDEPDASDRDLLLRRGWHLVDPRAVAPDPLSYQQYVAGSKAEVAIAKQMYVATRSGWFSDRSACYLASGKPVLAQDTGLDRLYPLGEGLLTFSTLEEAVAGVDAIERDYAGHARAARAVAEERLDSDRVLMRLLEQLAIA